VRSQGIQHATRLHKLAQSSVRRPGDDPAYTVMCTLKPYTNHLNPAILQDIHHRTTRRDRLTERHRLVATIHMGLPKKSVGQHEQRVQTNHIRKLNGLSRILNGGRMVRAGKTWRQHKADL